MNKFKLALVILIGLVVNSSSAGHPKVDKVCHSIGYWNSICYFTAPDGRACALADNPRTGIALDCDWNPAHNQDQFHE